MSTIITLHDAMCDFMEKEIAPLFKFKTAGEFGKEPFIHPQVMRSGWIMPRSLDGESKDAEAYPYIVPRIHSAENLKNARESIVTLDVHFGVFDYGVYDPESGRFVEDGSGYRDLWNLIETTRQAFFTNRIIAKKFRLFEEFFEADLIDEQIYPYWEGFCRTKWNISYPLPHLDL